MQENVEINQRCRLPADGWSPGPAKVAVPRRSRTIMYRVLAEDRKYRCGGKQHLGSISVGLIARFLIRRKTSRILTGKPTRDDRFRGGDSYVPVDVENPLFVHAPGIASPRLTWVKEILRSRNGQSL